MTYTTIIEQTRVSLLPTTEMIKTTYSYLHLPWNGTAKVAWPYRPTLAPSLLRQPTERPSWAVAFDWNAMVVVMDWPTIYLVVQGVMMMMRRRMVVEEIFWVWYTRDCPSDSAGRTTLKFICPIYMQVLEMGSNVFDEKA